MRLLLFVVDLTFLVRLVAWCALFGIDLVIALCFRFLRVFDWFC